MVFEILMPEFILIGTAAAVFAINAILRPKSVLAPLTCLIGVILSAIYTVNILGGVTASFGVFYFEAGIFALKAVLLCLSAAVVVFALNSAVFGCKPDFFGIMPLNLASGFLLLSVKNFLLFFTFLELFFVSLVLLVRASSQTARSIQNVKKILFMGATASVIFLAGLGIFYFATGGANMGALNLPINDLSAAGRPAVVAAVLLMLAGLMIKSGVAPFHSAVFDTFYTLPLSAGLYILLIPYGIFMILFHNLFLVFFAPFSGVVVFYTQFFVITSFVLALLGIYAQPDLKKLLFFSVVLMFGFVLIALASNGAAKFYNAFYNFISLSIVTAGLCGLLMPLENSSRGYSAGYLDGLQRKSFFLPVISAVFLCALAGVPFLPGFTGKILVLADLLKSNQQFVFISAITAWFISSLVFLRLIWRMFAFEPAERSALKLKPVIVFFVLVCALLLAVISLFPQKSIDFLIK